MVKHEEPAAPRLVPLGELRESPHNPRKTFGDLGELAQSLSQQGVLQPLVARETAEGLELIFGHRRLRAAELAGLRAVPVLVREMSDEQALEAQLVENSQRQDIHPMEEAEGYERLQRDYGYSGEKIAEKVGKTKAYVYARLKLLSLVEAARKEFYAGRLSASSALLIARMPGERLQLQATAELSKLDLSYREAFEHLRKRFGNALSPEKEAGKAKRKKTAQAQARARAKVTSAVLGRAAELLERKPNLETPELRLMALALPADEAVLRRRGWETPEQLASAVQRKLGASQLRALVFELAVSAWVRDGGGKDYSPNLKALAKAFGVSIREMESGIEE